MKSFTVLTPVQSINLPDIEMAVYSFARFYFSVTSKHRPFLKMVIVDDGAWLIEIMRLLKTFKVAGACQMVIQEKVAMPEIQKEQSLVMFLPSIAGKTEWMRKALAIGMPILGFEGLTQNSLLDNSCGMLIARHSKEQNVNAFSGLLKILYFDPGAQEMLRMGALRRYNNILPLNQGQYLTQVA